ncbi:Uncharacterized protein FKW44_008273, partial [Caligus rogercresseyi]
LYETNKRQRVKCCQDLLKLFQDHREDYLGSHMLVQDKSWFYWDSTEQGEVCVKPTGETDCEEDDDRDGVHHYLSGPQLTMISQLTTSGHRFNTHKQHRIHLKDCLLMWDNARPQGAAYTKDFLTRRDVKQVKQSLNSPELNLCDRYLFRKSKYLLWNDEFGATK